MSKEVWRPVVGYEGSYEVSDLGNVRSVDRKVLYPFPGTKKMAKRFFLGKKLILCPDKDGYLTACLSINQNREKARVHRLVADAFIPNPENKPHVNHLNSNVTDNRVKNLEWCTPLENTAHLIKHGKGLPRGDNHHNSKLSYKDVEIIKDRINNGETYTSVAKTYNCHYGTISRLYNGITWIK